MGTQQFCLKWNNHQSNMLTVFEQLLSTEALVDVTLACDGLSLKAHKMVLSACSPFFQSLFLENPCKHPIVIMKDMRYSDLKAIIDFMYRGEVNVSHDQLNALLRTAETLKVKGLAEVSGENRTASGMVQQEIVQQNITTTQTPSSGPPSQTRSDSPPLHSKRKRGRPRKRSLSDSNRSDDDSAPPKIKEPDSPEIEELSNDTSHDANDISQNISSNSQTQVHPSLQSSAVHNSLSKTLPNISSIQASQESQVEEPASDDGDFEVEPSKLMEQSLTTDVSVMSNSQAQNTIAPSSVHLPLPSSSGLIDNSRSLVPTTGGDSQSLVPVSVSIPQDSLSSSQMQGPDSPQDIKPTAFLSIEEPPISPVAGPSHQSDRSMMMYMDTSGVPAIPGTSFQQDSQSAIVQHESQPQVSCKCYKMSRFFATGSDSESESSSSEEEPLPQKATTAAFTFSDEEEETKRVVRSAREKRYEELVETIKLIKNHKKIKDMSKLLTSFENLTRAFMKARPVIEKEENGIIPKFYIRSLVELDDFVVECWEDREGRKNMSKNNSKSLATLRQKLRKYNKDFENDISGYRECPDDEEKDEEELGSDEDDDDKPSDFFKKSIKEEKEEPKSKMMKGSDDEDSDVDSIDWDSTSEGESSSSSDDEKYGGNLAMKFLKKAGEKDEQKEATKREKKRDKREERKRRDDDDDDNEGWEEVRGGAPIIMEKPKMFAKDAEINHQVVQKKFNEILAARGKKGTDRSEQIELLVELRSICELHDLGPGVSLKITFAIIAAIFDYNPNIATCMKGDVWLKCLDYITYLLDMVILQNTIVVGEHISEESENISVPPYRVRGCCLTVVERMDDEFTKMLQGCDAHSPEYVDRLKDETMVCAIIEKLQSYLEEKGTPSELCRVYLRRIEHLYYKFDAMVFKKRAAEQDNESLTESERENIPEKTSINVLEMLCKYIYAKDTTDRIRTQAILFQIYHHSLHGNWFQARDLMLMSHLQHNIQMADVTTQIYYNRALVQLGLCSFCHGNIQDAHNALLDIQSGGRAKELLAQGLLPQRQHERTPEQEKIEKRRQVPFHKHINLELLECVYLVSATLLEVPYMSAHELDGRKRMISKSFHHQLRNSERQALVGPPESMREHVVAASKAMRVGNWKACKNFIINEKMNSKVWNLFHQPEKVREMISQKIQEEALRTYLFTYSKVYDSLSVYTLADMFELERSIVHSIISKMILNEELMASLDEPTQTVILHRTEPSRIQALALQMADKASSLVDQNEKLYEIKHGSYFGRGMGQQTNYRDSNYQKGQQSNYRDSNYQKGNYGQQDRSWGRRTGQRNY